MRSCAVVGCSNSTNRLKRWKSSLCLVHKTTYGSEQCDCDPPFRLFSFPGAIKDPEHRKQWVEMIKRKDTHTGQPWVPKQESRVCSKHFVDGKPTEDNPNPTLHLFQMDTAEIPSVSRDDGKLPDNFDKIKQKLTVKVATVPKTAKSTPALGDVKDKEQESKRISPRKTADMGRSKGKQQQQQKVVSKKSKTRSSSSSSRDEIELLMECFEEALSPAQMKAIKQAQADHEKANDQIKEIRAGNTLVPSSQPNTFTIVPPTPKPQPAPPPPPPPPQAFPQPEPRSLPMPTLRGVMKAQPLQPRPQAQQVLTPPQKTAQNGKNLSELRAQQLTPRAPAPQPSIPQKSSPDIILISETPAPSKPVVQTSPQLVPALPQQMYKMVPPGSQLTPLSQGQWVIRPLVTVSPQQMVATVPPSLQKSSPASTSRVPAIQPAFANGVYGPNQMVLQSWGSGERRTTETVQSWGPSKRGICHTVYSLGSSEKRATESSVSRQEHNQVGRVRETESSVLSSNISEGKAACMNRTCCTYSFIKKLRMVLASHFSDRDAPGMSLKQTSVICCRKQSDMLLKFIRNKVNKCRKLYSNAEKQIPSYQNAELRKIQCDTSEVLQGIKDIFHINDLKDIQIETEQKSVSKECSELKQPFSSQTNGFVEGSAKNQKVFVKPNYSETQGFSLLLQNAESRPVCDRSFTSAENFFVLCGDELHKNRTGTVESQLARLEYFISCFRTKQNNRIVVKQDYKCCSQLDKRSAIDIEIPSEYVENVDFSRESTKDQHVISTAEGIRNEPVYQNSVYSAESLEASGSEVEVKQSGVMFQACLTDGYTVSAKDKRVENHENMLFEEPFNIQFSDKSLRKEIRAKDTTGHENVKHKSFENITQVINEESYSRSKPSLKSNFWIKKFDHFHKQREIEVWTARSVLGKSDRTTEKPQGSNRNTSSDPVLSQVSNPEIMELNVAENSNMSVSSEISSADVPLHGTNVGAFSQNTNAASGSSLIDTSVDIGIPQRSVRFSQSFHIPSFGDSLSFDSDEELNSQDAYQFPSTNESSNSVPSQTKECKNQPASHLSAVEDEDSNFGFNVNENEPNDRLLLAKSYREDIEKPAEYLAESISLRIKTTESAKDSEQRSDERAESDKDDALVDYLTTESAENTIKSTALTEASKINDDNTHIRIRERINLGIDQNTPSSLESQSVKDTFVKNFKERDTNQKEAGKSEDFSIDESTSVDETDSFTETKTVSDPRIQSHVNVSDISTVLESNVAGTIACNMRNIKDKANFSRESADKDKKVKKDITTVIENIKSLKSTIEDKNQKNGSRPSCNKKSMSDSAANENESSGSDSEDRLMIDFNYDSDHGNCFSSGDDEDDFDGRSRLKSSALETIASQNSGVLASPGIESQCVAVSSSSSTFQDSDPTEQLNKQSCEIGPNNMGDGSVKLDSPQVRKSTGESADEEKTSPFEDHSYFRNKLSSLLGKASGMPNVEEVTDSQAEWSPVVGKTLAFEQSEVQPFDGRNLVVYKALSEQQKKEIFDSYMKHGIDETCKTHNIPVENLREILKEYFESRLHEVENLIGSKPASVSLDEGKVVEAQVTVKSTNKMEQRSLTGADNIARSTKSKRENSVIQVAEILPTVLPKKANITAKFNEQNASSQRDSSDSVSELKCFEIKDDDYITDKLGRRLYSYDFKKRVVNLADRFGDINVGNQVNLDKKTVQKWRHSCMKFDQNKALKHDKTEKGQEEGKKIEEKKESKIKRFRYSESLKIKLVYMAKMYGVSNVVKQYGVKKTTLQLWNQILCDRKLPSYELTDKDLLELVDGAEHAKQQSVTKTVVPSQPHNIDPVIIDGADSLSRELHTNQHDVHGSLNEKVTGNSSQIEKPVIPDNCSRDDNTSTENTFPSAIPVILEAPSSSAGLQRTSDRQQAVTSLLRKALSKLPPEKQAVGQPSAAYIHGSNVVFRYDLPKASKEGNSLSSLVTKSVPCTNESLRTSTMPNVASSLLEPNPLLASYSVASSMNLSSNSVVKVANVFPAKKPISVSGDTMNVDNLQRSAAESTTDLNRAPAVKILSVQHIHPDQPPLSQTDLHHVQCTSVLPAPPALHKYGRISTETRVMSEYENVQDRDKNAVSVAQNTSTTVFSDGFQTGIAQAPQVYSHPASMQTQVCFTSKSCTLSNPPSYTPVVCVQSKMSKVTTQTSSTTPIAICPYVATSNYSPAATSSSILTSDKQTYTSIPEPVVYTQSETSVSTAQIKQEPENDNEYSHALGYSQPYSTSGSVNIQSISANVPVFMNTVQSSCQVTTSVTFSQSTYRNTDLSSKQYPAVYVFNRDGRITNVSDAGVGKQTAGLMTYPLPKFPVTTATSHTVLTDSLKGGKQTSVMLKHGGKTIYATVVATTQASESNPSTREASKDHSMTIVPTRVDFQSEFKKQMGIKKDDKVADKEQQEINQQVHAEIGVTSETKQTSQAVAPSPSELAKKLQEFQNSINTSQVSIDLLYQMQLLKQFKRQKNPLKTESHATMTKQLSSESRINTLIKNVSGRLKKHLKKTDLRGSISSASNKVKDDTGITEKKGCETDSSSPQKNASPRDEYFAGKSYFRFSHGLKLKLGVKANKEKTSAASLAKRYHVSEKSIAKWRTMFADSTLTDTTLSKKQQEELLAHKQWVQERKELGKLKVNEDKDFQIYIDNPESADGLVASKADDGDTSIIEGPESAVVHQLNQNGIQSGIIQVSANDSSSLETSKNEEVTKQDTEQVLKKCHSDSAVVMSNIERQKELEREITSVQRKILKKNTARKSTTQGRMVSKVIKQRSYDDDGKSENNRSVENEGSVLTHLKSSSLDSEFASVEEIKQKNKETKRVPSPVFDVPLYIEAQDPEITNDERNDIRKTWVSVFQKRDKHKGIFETTGNWPENNYSHLTSLQTLESCEDSIDSPDVICLDDTVDISEHENHSCSGTRSSANSKSIKEVSVLEIEPSSSSMISKSVKDKNVLIYTKEGNLYPLAGDPKYSLEFKLKIVKEARESGCENAAKWYQLSVEDVRKWHDTVENDKQLQFRLSVMKCAKVYGMKQAERLYSVSEQKISDWLDQECEDTLTLNEHSGIFEDKGKDHWEGLQFERFKNGEVSILRPKFDIKSMADGDSREESPVGFDITSNNRTRTRMGGNSVSFASGQNFSKAREVHSSSSKEFEKEYLADVEGDIGAMPRIVKQKSKRSEKNDTELEIASTWKQVQDYVQQPDKIKEKKFSADFKAKIIKLCSQKGQKTVAKEYKIPYNKISRWRLKAKSDSEVFKASELQKTSTDSPLVIKINLKDEPKVMSHVNQTLEPEKSEFSDKFKKEVVLYSRKHGFISAAREYKIGTPRILSWIRQFRSFSFDATENQTVENKMETTPVKDVQKCKPKKVKSPRQSSGHIETSSSSKGNKSGRRSSVHSENFHQDYIISKSSVGKDSALKITLSPRRKSPAPSKASSDEGSEIDDFEEVATWSADEAEKDKSDVIEVSDDDIIEIKDTDEKHVSKLDGINRECIVINDDKDEEDDRDNKDIEFKHSLPSEKTRETVSDRKELHSSSLDIGSNSQESQVKPVSGNLYDLLESDEISSTTVKPPDEFPINNKESQPETELDLGLLPLSDSSLVDNEVQSTETKKLESGTQLKTGKQKTSFGGKENFQNDTESTETVKEYQNKDLSVEKKDLSVVLQDYRVKDKEIATATSAETVKIEVPEVPYEETLMFKVFSANMDEFFNGSFQVSKPLSEIGNIVNAANENPEKSDKPAVRKRKMTADVEIMGNLDEKYREYLFGPEPFPEDEEFINEGNSSQPDWVESPENKDEANETEEEASKQLMLSSDLQENTDDNEAKMEFDKVDHKEVSLGHELECVEQIKQIDDTDKSLAKAETDRKNSEGMFKNLFTDFSVSSDVAVPVEKNNQKPYDAPREPQTRNVFDFMTPVSGMETGNDEVSSKKTESENKDIQNEGMKSIESHFSNKDIKLENANNCETVNKCKSSRESSPFNLFGSLMKNIKLPASLSSKNLGSENMSERKSESKYQNEEVCAEMQGNEESESKSKNVGDVKEQTIEKGNRNLFDFLSPVSNKPEKQELQSPEIPVSSPMPGLFERLKVAKESNNAGTSKEENSSKLSQPPKTAFKFLSLPVNFGNIAKLGIAKLKEDKNVAKETNSSTEQKNEDSNDGITKTGKFSVNTVTESTGKTSDIQLMAAGDSTEICTFEYQTTNCDFKSSNPAKKVESNSAELTNDMGAKEISREEIVDNIEITQKDTMLGNENNGDKLDNDDDELYMSFAPQKVILILDISKKHGIEFASTSFGLPPKVIVNWIIEKDRKHRKVASSYTLEEKLTAIKQCEYKKIEEVSSFHKIDVNILKSWKEEVAWVLESPGVLDVLQKWSRVQASISLEDDGKTNLEMTKKDEEMGRSADHGVETAAAGLEKVECSSKESSDISVTSQLEKLPDVLSFAKTTHPKEYSVEQKAIVVLLLDKYGVTEVNKKLGISTKTLWGWKHRSKAARDYILTHSGLSSPKKRLSHKSEENSDKLVSDVTLSHRLATDVTLKKESKSVTDQFTENIETRSVTRQANEKLQEARKLMAQPAVGNSPLKGYRLISPTKIPSILQDVRKLPTKDFTLDQRVAIVKLVDLYGVRTVHKQFRIPAGSIWNWQHSKAVMALARPEGGVEKAKKNLDFDETEAAKSKPDTIETIMERVKTNLKSLNHLQLNSHQKADAVCLVNYYGIDIVFKALKIIPRGTLWNWCHNKYVGRIVEKKMQLLQEADLRKNSPEKENSEKNDSHRNDLSENIEQSVDRKDFTQKWLRLCHQDGSGRKRKSSGSSSVTEMSLPKDKKTKNELNDEEFDYGNFSDNSDYSEHSDNHLYEEIDIDLGESLNSSAGMLTLSSSLTKVHTASSIVSSVSIHSGDYEEVVSDEEQSRSSRSRVNSQGQRKKSHSGNRQTKKLKVEQSEASSADIGCVEDLKDEIVEVPTLEVDDVKFAKDNRMFVSFKVTGTKNVYLSTGEEVTSKLVEGTPGSGLKKASEPATPSSSPLAKKKTPPGREKEPPGEINSSGNWVPLDEYYYGTMDGDQNYEEEKGEFRFKCWYCSKMLYNNVRAMQHIQGHIDSSKQQNIDLSDLTQCKQCYKQFDTPFEMQTHMEKVHLSNKVLMCRICEKDQPTPRDLTQHMRQNHHPCEMPYVCQLCNFRSSMYNDVVDHFKKKHDSSQHLLCLYCLRTFLVKFVSQGWGQTQTYYGHLLKHQSKSTTKKCVICRLTFFNSQDVKLHRKTHHIAHHKGVLGIKDGKYQQQEQVMIKLPPGQVASSKQKVVKSLNVPASCKVLDIGGVVLPGAVSTSKCVECKTSMGSTDHYKKFINCSMCRFATSCSIAYANHMMGFHSGQMSSLNLNIPWERPMPQPMYCSCGFSSKFGNKIANHLAFCSKQTCFKTSQGSPPSSAEKSKATEKGDENLLDVLGLMKRRSLTTRGKRAAVKDESGSRTREKSEEKSEPTDSKKAKIEKEAEPVDSKKAIIEKEVKDEKKKPGPKKKPKMGPKKRMAQIKAARARRGEKEETEEEMDNVDTEVTEKKELEAAENDISKDADKITDKNILKDEGSDDKSEVAGVITDKEISKDKSSEDTDSTAIDKAANEEGKEDTGIETVKEEESAGVRTEEQDSSNESGKDAAGDVIDKSDEPKVSKDEKNEESMEVSEAQADDTGNKDVSNEAKPDKESETAEADKADQMSDEKEVEGKVDDSVKKTGADDEVEAKDNEMIDQTETDNEKLENVQDNMETEMPDTDTGAKDVSAANDNLESTKNVADSLAGGCEESSKVDENMEVDQEEEREEDIKDQSHDLNEELQNNDIPKETEELSEEIVPSEEEKTETAELEESKEAGKSEMEESEESVRADSEEKADDQSESAAEKDTEKQVSASASEDKVESDKEIQDSAGGTEAEIEETAEAERGGDANDPKAESSELEPPAQQTQGDSKSGQLEESAESSQETSKESATDGDGDSKNKDTQQPSSSGRQSSHERSQEREHGSHRDSGSHGDSRHSHDHDRHQENRSYDNRHRSDDRHRHDNRSHGDRHGYDDRYRHDDRSRGGYQGGRSYDRNWDNRDRSYDRDHRGGDYRRDDRGQQGYNRGPQDRNQDYNRNQHGYNRGGGYRGNFRGGYNQNYRGGYRGGYY